MDRNDHIVDDVLDFATSLEKGDRRLQFGKKRSFDDDDGIQPHEGDEEGRDALLQTPKKKIALDELRQRPIERHNSFLKKVPAQDLKTVL